MSTCGKISFSAAVLMSINIMVGGGIMYAVDPLTAAAGSVSFFGWPLIGLMLFPIIWSISKAAELFPGEGGFYHYGSQGLNPTAGFIAHWGYLLGYMGTAASVATLLRNGMVNTVGLDVIGHYPYLFNFVLVLFYTLINLMALEKISKLQSIATLLKIAPLMLVIALLAFYFQPQMTFNLSDLSHMQSHVSTVIFAFWGFEACCSLGSLLKDGPQRIPSVILVGFGATMALYFLFHAGLMYIMGPENLVQFGALAFPQFLGLPPFFATALQVAVSCAVLFCWANSILGVSLGNITNIYSLARHDLIFGSEQLTQVNRHQRPTYAALAHGVALFSFITFINDIDILFALTNLGVIIAFGITLWAVFLANMRQGNYGDLVVTSMAIAACAALLYYSWLMIPSFAYTLPLALGMAVGIAMFKVQQRRRLKAAAT